VRRIYQAVFLAWFGFTIGICVWLACYGEPSGCTRQATDGQWTASVHSPKDCEDAQRRADMFLADPNYRDR